MDNSNQFNMFSTKKNGQPFVALDRYTPKNAQEATLPPLAPNSDLDLKEVPAWLKEADRSHMAGMAGMAGMD